MYIDKKVIYKILLLVVIIAIAIISVNIRLDKNLKTEEEYIGYISDDPNAETIIGSAPNNNIITFYDYDKIVPYFVNYGDSVRFKIYLNDYIISKGSKVRKWWIKEIEFDEKYLTLIFYIKSNITSEMYYVEKNNDGTLIERIELASE